MIHILRDSSSFYTSATWSCHIEAAVQVLGDLPLVPKHPQSCSKHAGAAVQVPGDLLLVPKQSQSFSKHGEAAVQCRYLATSPIFLSNWTATFELIWNNDFSIKGYSKVLHLSNLGADLAILKQLCRCLVTFHLFQSNLRDVINIFGYDDYHSHSEIKQKGSNQDVKDKLIWFRLILVSSGSGRRTSI